MSTEQLAAYRLKLEAAAARCGVPRYMIDGVIAYICDRRPPGGFLRHVLENDLMGALGKADEVNINCLPAYGRFLYNHAPCGSHGSPENVRTWLGQASTTTTSEGDNA